MSQNPRPVAPVRPAYTAKVVTKPIPSKAAPEVKAEAASVVPEAPIPAAAVAELASAVIEEPVAVAVEAVAVAEVADPPPVEAAQVEAAQVEAAQVEAVQVEAVQVEAGAPVPEMPADVDHVPPAAVEAVRAAETLTPTLPTSTPMQGLKTMMKSTEDFVAFGQANIEAFVKSGQIWSAGVQELTKQFATTAKASFDESVSTFKAMSTVKSVKEAIEMQSTFAKTSMEKAIVESNKLTDASIKLTEQALAPITARVTTAVETFSKAA